jgi:TolB protein
MKKFFVSMTILVTHAVVGNAQDNALGIFKGFTHIGSPEKKGSVQYNADNQEYTLEGASGNMWFANDDFHFLWRRMKGNFILTFQAEFLSAGVDAHRKVGWMVRHSLESNSPQINAVVHGDGLTSLQYRKYPGADTEEVKSADTGADIIQLERRGTKYIMSTAKFGNNFTPVEISDIQLGDDVYVGLFLCSHNEAAAEKALFKNVRVVVPPKEGFVPYKEYLGSHLELMDIEKGNRKVIYSENVSLQAPNWTVDGKSLIYNREGLLYNFDLQTRKPTVINTDFANRNNNDHVLSFDGTMLAISHHAKEDNGVSMVYTVPANGGVPFKVTAQGPSYLHGWSTDKKYLIYTGQRENEFDIYKISAKGGKETRLTTSKGLDDGSEYSPDGKWIYYNSVRSGTMQLWRMKPDGSKAEQLTDDEFNNWFPHISPDGKWIVYLAFGKDVSPSDHPFYKQVFLKLIPVPSGKTVVMAKPKTLAYLFGGQGTINVPSWSPDSKRIAFVSNSDFNVN